MGTSHAVRRWRRMTRVGLLALGWAVLGVPEARAQAVSVPASENPRGLEPFGAIERGKSLFDRPGGHLPYGLTDTAWTTDDATRRLSADDLGALHAGMGATMVRLPLFWPEVEPAYGERRWQRYDELYRALIRHGVRPLWTVEQTPRHWVETLRRTRCRGYHCDDEPAPDQLAAITTFARELARRYPLSAAFEYRNEPNVSRMTPGPRIPADRYVRGLRAFHRGMKEGRAESRVLGGALAMDRGFSTYLVAMLDAGAVGVMDALSFHPYWNTHDPSGLAVLFTTLDKALASRGRTDLRLVPDEAGVSTTPEVAGAVFDEAGQRDRMLTWYRLLDKADPSVPLSAQVDAAVMFTTVDGAPGDGFGGYGFFTRRADGTMRPRPVFCGFREQIAGLASFTGGGPFGACPATATPAKRKKVLRSCPRKRSRTGKVCRCRTVTVVVKGRRKKAKRCGYSAPRKRASRAAVRDGG